MKRKLLLKQQELYGKNTHYSLQLIQILTWNSNLCIDGGYDICGEMYNKNILSPLKTFVPKVCLDFEYYFSHLNNHDPIDLKHIVSIPSITKRCPWKRSKTGLWICWQCHHDSLVPFVSSSPLCFSEIYLLSTDLTRETSNKALSTINQISLVPFLMSFLAAREKLPTSTVTSAGEVLYAPDAMIRAHFLYL